jgi:hypothetical protein
MVVIEHARAFRDKIPSEVLAVVGICAGLKEARKIAQRARKMATNWAFAVSIYDMDQWLALPAPDGVGAFAVTYLSSRYLSEVQKAAASQGYKEECRLEDEARKAGGRSIRIEYNS